VRSLTDIWGRSSQTSNQEFFTVNKPRLEKRVRIKNILFLTDFSWASESAIPFVREIAQEYQSKVTALHVTVPDVLTYMTPDSPSAAIELQHDFALAEMKKVETQLSGVSHQVLVMDGKSVWAVVESILQAEDFDLIIVGTHGRTGLPQLLMGSTAEEIFRCSSVPVMTIGPSASPGEVWRARWQRILFASDFTAEADAAAPFATSFAEENNAQLVLLHVIETKGPRKAARRPGTTVAEVMHNLHEIVPPEAVLWCRPETVVEHGDPATRILAVANEKKVDLIVLGTRNTGHVMVTSHLEKTIAHTVLAHAPCPVLTVRS
jgi:nucleotide-binding universal stress UspA family protein